MITFMNGVEFQRDDSRENVKKKFRKLLRKVLAEYKFNLTLANTLLNWIGKPKSLSH